MRTIALALALLLAGCAQPPSTLLATRPDLPAPRVVTLPTRAATPAPELPLVAVETEVARLDVEPVFEARASFRERPMEPTPVARVAPPVRREGAPPCDT